MAWLGLYEGPLTMKESYQYPGKTDPDMLGQGNMWVRRGMMRCCQWLMIALGRRKLNMRIPPKIAMNTMSKWVYPRECSKCSLAGGCSEFLRRAELRKDVFPYDSEKVINGTHTGWENLHWEQKYRDYRRIDSLEDTYPNKR